MKPRRVAIRATGWTRIVIDSERFHLNPVQVTLQYLILGVTHQPRCKMKREDTEAETGSEC